MINRTIYNCLVIVVLLLPSSPSMADESEVAPIQEEPSLEPAPFANEQTGASSTEETYVSSLQQRWAAGINFAWQTRRDYGARDYKRFAPEIVGYMYGGLPVDEFFWRLGTRIGHTTDQPEMPQAVRIEETDTTWLVEAGFVRNWFVVPSLAFGYGYDFKTTKVKIASPVDAADDRLNRKERLPVMYVQTGVGFPIYKGLFMIEPLIRYHSIDTDFRSHWTFGVEWTAGF